MLRGGDERSRPGNLARHLSRREVHDKQRLPALLAESRKYQNTVSTELAGQVLAALFELLRGFQAADDQRKGELLRDVLAHEPDQV